MNTNLESKQYSFSLDQNFSSTPDQLKAIEGKIGKSIDPKAEDISTKSIAALVLTGLLLGTVREYPHVIHNSCPDLPALGLDLIKANLTDYKSPIVRDKVIREIASASFEKIMSYHSSENILEYALLDEIPAVKKSTPEQRAIFYATFDRLAKEAERLKKWSSEENKTIRNAWYEEYNKLEQLPTDDLKARESLNEWMNGEMSKIQNVWQNAMNSLESSFNHLTRDPT